MKAKKLALLMAGILSVASLAACGDKDKKILWGAYWEYDSIAGGEMVNETLTYAVTFEKGAGEASLPYTLSYGEGSYVTHLKKNADRVNYTYTTELTMPVSYEYGGEKESFEDKITTTLSFDGKTLRPLSSTKTVVSHTPSNAKASALSDCYVAHGYTVTTEYKAEGKAVGTVLYTQSQEKESAEFTYGKGHYSYLDNEALLLGLRAVPAETLSGSVDTYNPFLKYTQRVKFSFEDTTGGEFFHTVNGNPLSSKDISYRSVSLTLTGKNPGATQTAWIATTEAPDKNTHRNVLLYLETPLSYSLGILKYTLKSVQNG